MWIPTVLDANKPRYVALSDTIAQAIESGILTAGEKLPTHRWLADRLGVTVGTVSRAYQEAERLGLVQAKVGSGTFVYQAEDNADGFSMLDTSELAENLVDMSVNLPVPAEQHGLQLALRDIADRLPTLNLLGYQPEQGAHHQRMWAQNWLATKQLPVDLPRITITMGGQHCLMLSLMAIAKAGDIIASEGVTYPGIAAIAMQLGIKIMGLPMDMEGVLPDAFESACKQNKLRALYLTPQVQNPTNASMGLQRRRDLIAVAKHHHVMIIEDTVSESYIDDLSISFAALAPEQCFTAVSHSKHLAGGLRVGYLIAPVTFADRLGQAVRAQCWSTSALLVEATQRWINTQDYRRMEVDNLQELAYRRAFVTNKLCTFSVVVNPQSSHVWLPLEEPWRAQDLQQNLLVQGIKVLTGDAFSVGRFVAPQAIRFCIGAVRSRTFFEQAVDEIAQQLRCQAKPRLTVF
jgi:DNA-binding transcriptional MocR family regulator